MTPKLRTLSGATLMLVIIPIIVGLLACMPVPIGDPERSKADPDMTGIWAALTIDDSETGAGFYLIEPYDKRTMLISAIGLAAAESTDLEKYDFASYAGYEKLAANEEVDADNVHADGVSLNKSWVTKLAGERFFTWEPMGVAEALGKDPEYWMVWHIVEHDEENIVLRLVDGDAAPFKNVEKTRRAYERVLKKHVDDPAIYGEPDGYRIHLVRADGVVLEFLSDVADLILDK